MGGLAWARTQDFLEHTITTYLEDADEVTLMLLSNGAISQELHLWACDALDSNGSFMEFMAESRTGLEGGGL